MVTDVHECKLHFVQAFILQLFGLLFITYHKHEHKEFTHYCYMYQHYEAHCIIKTNKMQFLLILCLLDRASL